MMSRSTRSTPTVTAMVIAQTVGEATESPRNASTKKFLRSEVACRRARGTPAGHGLRRSLPFSGLDKLDLRKPMAPGRSEDQAVMTTPPRRNTPLLMGQVSHADGDDCQSVRP